MDPRGEIRIGHVSRLLAVVGLAMLVPACTNEHATLFGGGGESLANDVQPIFTLKCAVTGCHAGTPPAENLSLEASDIFTPVIGVVGVPSTQVPGLPRVTPNDIDASYLIHKVQGTQVSVGGFGDQMPLGGPALSASEILTLRQWVQQGALDN